MNDLVPKSDTVLVLIAVIGLLSLITTTYGNIVLARIKTGQTNLAHDQSVGRREAALGTEQVRKTLERNVYEVGRQTTVVAKEDTLQELRDNTEELRQGTKNLATVAKATHSLVNSSYAVALREIRDLLREKAATSNNPDDHARAARAEQRYLDHQAQEAVVNAQPGTDDQKAGRTDTAA